MKIYLKITIFPKYIFAFGKWLFFFIYLQHLYLQKGRMDYECDNWHLCPQDSGGDKCKLWLPVSFRAKGTGIAHNQCQSTLKLSL